MWDTLRGHQTQVDLFKQATASGRLAQAYLFAGEQGVGKRHFARCVAAGLLCQNADGLDACGQCPSCKQVKVQTHPDLLEVGCPKGKTAIPIALLVGEDGKRGREGLCYELSLKPVVSTRRVAIIDDVETLQAEGANALLKTLEEPPNRAVFFLIVDRPEAVLTTIRSRCQLVRFFPLPDRDIAELLVENGDVEDSANATAIAELAGGSLAAAVQLADPAVRELRGIVNTALSPNSIARPMHTAKTLLAAIEDTASDGPGQRKNARWALRFLCDLLRSALRRSAGVESAAIAEASDLVAVLESGQCVPADVIGSMLDRVVESENQLKRSMPLLLCFESLLDDLRKLKAVSV